MEYDFKDEYLAVNGNISIKINVRKLKGKLQKAQSDLAYSIIADTEDYVPFNQGILSNSVHLENENTEIVYSSPYARFLYMGKLMLDDRGSSWARKNTKKHTVNKNLSYSKEHHSKACAKWYEASKKDNLEKWILAVKKAISGSGR